jgi:hypothetical protein
MYGDDKSVQKNLALKREERKSLGISKRRRVENRPASGF